MLEKEWIHSKLRCRIIRHNGLGHLCGYVALPPTHKYWGVCYDDIPVDVHGGLTFAQRGDHSEYYPDSSLWWVGFDCAHAGDICPNMPPFFSQKGHLWTVKEVEEETNKLAEQLARLKGSQLDKLISIVRRLYKR